MGEAGGWSSWMAVGRDCHPSGCRSCSSGSLDRAFLLLRLSRNLKLSPSLLKLSLFPELQAHSRVWCRDCLPLPAVVLRRGREAYDVVGFTLLPEPRTHEFRGQQKAKCDERGGEGMLRAGLRRCVTRCWFLLCFACEYLSDLRPDSRPSSSRWTLTLTLTGATCDRGIDRQVAVGEASVSQFRRRVWMVLLVVVTVVRGCAADICDLPDLCRSRRQPVHSKVPRLDCVVFNGGKVCWSVGGQGETGRRRKKVLKITARQTVRTGGQCLRRTQDT